MSTPPYARHKPPTTVKPTHFTDPDGQPHFVTVRTVQPPRWQQCSTCHRAIPPGAKYEREFVPGRRPPTRHRCWPACPSDHDQPITDHPTADQESSNA